MLDSRLHGDEQGRLVGAHAGRVVVDDEPGDLAFDAAMFVRWPVLHMIEAAGGRENRVVHMNLADHQVVTVVCAEAVLSPIGGVVELGFALGNPECVAPKSDIRIE